MKAVQKILIVIVLLGTAFFTYSAIKAIQYNKETFELLHGITNN